MRIVGGSHRGRRLAAPEGRDTRPTADRAREALFNILRSRDDLELEGAAVLDAFAGSGAVGLEALSRGAAKAYFLESQDEALSAIKANIDMLKERGRAIPLRADATRPPQAHEPCALAFLDPPYHSDLAGPSLEALAARGWLADGAVVVVEVAAKEPFSPPPGFDLEDERVYGAARLVFLKRG